MKKISMSIDVVGVSGSDIKYEIFKFIESLSKQADKKINYTYSILEASSGCIDVQEYKSETR